MEKIKNIFNPGHKQDEEILYGSPSAQRPDSPTAGRAHTKPAADSSAQPQDSLNKAVEPEESRHANTTPLEATSAVSGTGKLSTPAQPATDGISAASVRSGVIGEAPQVKRFTDSELPVGSAGTSLPIAAGTAAGLVPTDESLSTSKEPSTPLRGSDRQADVPQHDHLDSNRGAETWQPDAPTPGPYIPGAFPITPQPYTQDRQLGSRDATIDPAGHTENTTGDALYDDHRSGSGTAGVSAVPGHDSGSTQTDSGNHHARDAAAGVVGAGVATAAATAAHEETGPASKTVDKHHSNVANVLDPTVLPQPDKQQGHQAIPSTETGTGPASKTVGRHSSNIANVIDPTVLPQPEKQTKHVTSGPHKSDMLNRLDPRVKSSESKDEQTGHGKDPAVAAGAYTADKTHHETPQTFQNASTTNAPTSQPPMIATTAGRGWHGGPTGTAVAAAGNSPPHSNSSPKSPRQEGASHPAQPHFEPGPALAGGGALAGAAAVYEYEKHKSHKADHGSHDASPGQLDTTTAQPTSTSPQATSSPDKHHYGRDAAIGCAGAAGVVASKHSSNPSDSSDPSATSPKSDKERSKEEKKHEKELAKEAKKREKDLAKEQKKAEKEQEKILAKEEKKHHHGLLGFLHRDKHKDSEGQGDQLDGTRDDVDGTSGAAATSAEIPIVGNPTPTRVSSLSGRNRLHKDPPKDFAAKAAQDNGHGNGQAVQYV
ncbi:hypothetical protein BKA80DRAFT_130394 [Phyllosticta citrichinensis]